MELFIIIKLLLLTYIQYGAYSFFVRISEIDVPYKNACL